MLLDSQEKEDANGVKYEAGVYTATVKSTQKEDNWQTLGTKDNTNMKIGGQDVKAVKDGATWTIKGTVATGKVEIATTTK